MSQLKQIKRKSTRQAEAEDDILILEEDTRVDADESSSSSSTDSASEDERPERPVTPTGRVPPPKSLAPPTTRPALPEEPSSPRRASNRSPTTRRMFSDALVALTNGSTASREKERKRESSPRRARVEPPRNPDRSDSRGRPEQRREPEPAKRTSTGVPLAQANKRKDTSPTTQPEPQPSTSRAASDIPEPIMADVIAGRAKLAKLAHTKNLEIDGSAILHALMVNHDLPRTPREGAINQVWKKGPPRITSLLIVATFNRDPGMSTMKAARITLDPYLTVGFIVENLSENCVQLHNLLYGLHCDKVVTTVPTTNYMLKNRHVLEKKESFIQVSYRTTRDTIIGRDEAFYAPNEVDIWRRNSGFQLRIEVKLLGAPKVFPTNPTATEIESMSAYLQREAEKIPQYTRELKMYLRNRRLTPR